MNPHFIVPPPPVTGQPSLAVDLTSDDGIRPEGMLVLCHHHRVDVPRGPPKTPQQERRG